MKRLRATFVLGCLITAAAATAQKEAPHEGALLWLDFDKMVDGGFPCSVSEAVCRADAAPHVEHGGALVSQYITLSVPDLQAATATSELTVWAWVAPAKQPRGYQSILYKGLRQDDAIQQIHFFLSLWDGRPEFKFKDEKGAWLGIMRNADAFLVPGGAPVSVADVPAVKANSWSHVAATFRAGSIALYLNGERILAGQVGTDHLVTNEQPLLIGAAQAVNGVRSYLFEGIIDNVRVHARALTPEQVRSLYTAERADKPLARMSITQPLPKGYDPDFSTKLPLVGRYEDALPAPLPKLPPTEASVQPYHGYPMLHVNGKPVYSMAMMPEPYASDEQITLSCRDFTAAGVDIYSEIFWSWATPREGCHSWWTGPGEYNWDRVDARVHAIIEANPRALIFPRVKLNPPKWWLEAHPDEVARHSDGKPAEQASPASLLWEATYEQMLRDFIRHMEQSDYANHIIGYHPAGGRASEWFWWGNAQEADYSPAALARYHDWLRERYGNDLVALRAAWGDGAASFETAQPPAPEARAETQHGVFRHPVEAGSVIDYRRFMSDVISHNICRSCGIVKEETHGTKIAGVFYGYSLYTHNYEGFQGLRRVLDCPDVDFLASPTAYDHRRGGEPGSFVSTYTASYRLHNKLFFDEVDTRTHLFPGFESYRTGDLAETLSVVQRAAGYSLTKGTSLWWFLLAGNATFHQAEVMDAISDMKVACDGSLDVERESRTQVAVFADEESMHAMAGPLAVRSAYLRGAVDELARMGAPYDIYLLSDIGDERLPEYRLYIFLNAFSLDDQTRRAISETVRRDGKTAVWVYAPGYGGETGFGEDGMSALAGMKVRASMDEVDARLSIVDAQHTITSALPGSFEWSWRIAPSFSVDASEGRVLGTTNGAPTLVVKEFDTWRSVYSMLPLRRELLQGLCRYAGVHVYSESLDPFFANSAYAMIHTSTAGGKRIVLERPADVRELVTREEIGRGLKAIEQELPVGVTRIYRLGVVR